MDTLQALNVLDTLKANVKNLSASDQDFANSLLSQSARRQLSHKQMAWVHTLAERATKTAATVEDPARVSKADLFNGVRSIFDRAIGEGMQKMAIRLMAADGTHLKMSLAADRQRVHYAEQGEGGRYFGYLDTKGEFHASGRVAHDQGVMDALRELDSNPIEVAISYGRRTGSCCVCGRTLTNKISVLEGIGPICSGRLA